MPTVPTEHLVVSGFYRYVRNPMYTGVLVALAGETILFDSRSWSSLSLRVARRSSLCLPLRGTQLTRRYGEEYLRFKRHVPRWLPRLTPWRGSGGLTREPSAACE